MKAYARFAIHGAGRAAGHLLLLRLDHLLDHHAADGAGVAGGQVAVIALLEVDAQLVRHFVLEAVHGVLGFGDIDLVIVIGRHSLVPP